MKRPFLLLLLCCLTATVGAKVSLPQLFQSGMVLQRGKPIPLWGTADPGETVTASWNRHHYSATADDSGRWRIDLPAQKAGGPYVLTIGDQVLTDVLVGDVWLCAGQSNMDIMVSRVYPLYEADIDGYANPKIRLFRVLTDRDTHGPKADVLPTRWNALTRESAWNFSAIGYFLARRMYEQTGVPQGIICNSVGGTPVEAWTCADSLERDFPVMTARTRLYQDDRMIEAQAEADRRANEGWYRLLNEADPGLRQPAWTGLGCDDSCWPRIHQQQLPEALKNTDFTGSLWLRHHIYINKERATKAARLWLGTLYDQDFTFVNGQEVGRTYYQYPPRRYEVPEGLLHEGDNVISVRLVNRWGFPHFLPNKPYALLFGEGDTLRLSDEWRLHVGTEMPPFPQGGITLQNLPSVLYNAMLAPLAPYAISGVVWYQGESNTDHPAPYATLLRRMMASWRALWNEQLPFCIVQLAGYDPLYQSPSMTGSGEGESQWALLRDAQRQVADSDPRAELAVALDLGETVDIHPLRKREVAERVALCMDRLVYAKHPLLSPRMVSAVADGQLLTLTFDQPLRPGKTGEVEVAGADGHYVKAQAEAHGTQLTVHSPVAVPCSVRYAWKDCPLEANLYSVQGLPAVPFEHTF